MNASSLRNRTQNRSKQARFPGLGADYIHPCITHEGKLVESEGQEDPRRAGFSPCTEKIAYNTSQTENDFSKGGYVNSISRRER